MLVTTFYDATAPPCGRCKRAFDAHVFAGQDVFVCPTVIYTSVQPLSPSPDSRFGGIQSRTLGPGTLDALLVEMQRARKKFPGNRFLLTALTEEVGELARALLQNKSTDDIKAEAIQVACVALRIFEEGDATFADIAPHESLA